MNKRHTIESCHSSITNNIELIGECLEVIKNNKIVPDTYIYQTKHSRIVNLYNTINNEYKVGIINILSEYYTNKHTGIDINSDRTNMYLIYISGFQKKISQCITYVTEMNEFKFDSTLNANIKKLNGMVNINTLNIKYDRCLCGSIMNISPSTSELLCESCGLSVQLNGVVFEHGQFYNQEGGRSKHGFHVPSKHCKYWIQCIQASERVEISNEKIDMVSQCIIRDNINKNRLMCESVRSYLKELKLTEFNDHVPYIRKRITGYMPPQFTHHEMRLLNSLLDKCVIVYEIVKPAHKSNTIFYPYIIYKILESILEDGIRKNKIMECIHLQGRDTLIASDIIWESVCKHVDEIEYKGTDGSVIYDVITN